MGTYEHYSQRTNIRPKGHPLPLPTSTDSHSIDSNERLPNGVPISLLRITICRGYRQLAYVSICRMIY